MRKAWVYQRKNRPGWYVGWYDSAGKKRSKRCPNKSLANKFARRLEFQHNEDLYPDPIATPWDELVTEYMVFKKTVKSLASGSLRSIQTTLTQFKELHGPVLSTKVDQRLVNTFIAHRLKVTGSKATVNKDLRNLRAFVRWSLKNRYMGAQAIKIDWSMQKEPKRRVKALTKKQLANLLIAAKKYQRYGDAWYIRVLLAVSSGLREGDVEQLRFSDIDFESASAITSSQKTGKGTPSRPLHPKAVSELSKYLGSVPEGQDKLFIDKFTSGKWKRIRNNARLPNLTFHDLRKTFASLVAQAGFSTSVVQDLLEHATPKLTHDVYTDIDPVRRKAVESIPLDDIITEL
jgi:integrase